MEPGRIGRRIGDLGGLTPHWRSLSCRPCASLRVGFEGRGHRWCKCVETRDHPARRGRGHTVGVLVWTLISPSTGAVAGGGSGGAERPGGGAQFGCALVCRVKSVERRGWGQPVMPPGSGRFSRSTSFSKAASSSSLDITVSSPRAWSRNRWVSSSRLSSLDAPG